MSTEPCIHPRRGRKEVIWGSKSGDHHCVDCGEPMPVLPRPTHCGQCGRTSDTGWTGDPDGEAWICPNCGRRWGWQPR